MAKKTKSKAYRQFLNSDSRMPGVVLAKDTSYAGYTEGSLTISDCSRQVTLDFDGNENKNQSLAKIEKLRKALDFIEGIIEEAE